MMLGKVVVLAVLSQYARLRIDEPDSQCLWWLEDTVVTVHFNDRGNADTPGDAELVALRRSIASWQRELTTCGSLSLVEGAPTSSRFIGLPRGGPEENVVLFRTETCTDTVDPGDACWKDSTCDNTNDCWAGSALAWAVTTTSFDQVTGKIRDSDIEFNSGKWLFTTVDSPRCPACPPGTQGKTCSSQSSSCVSSDVENTATHELGHLLGLAHFSSATSTMFATAPLGDTGKRVVDVGSAQFICDAYPAGSPARTCRTIPVDDELGRVAGCTTGAGPGPWAALASAILLWCRRRRW